MHALALTSIGLGAAGAAGLLYTRLGHRLFLKNPHTAPEQFGFALREPRSRQRVAEIIEAFFTGYNAAVAGRSAAEIRRRCEALPTNLHSFAFEGSGMGYGARCMISPRQRIEDFEQHIEAVAPTFQFMYYIGLGVWCGMRGTGYARRAAEGVRDRKYGGLVYDGFGFKQGFFHRVKNPHAHAIIDRLPAPARPHAYQGYGRSLWFVFRDDRDGLIAAARALPEEGWRGSRIGIGLAITFTSIDRLDDALAILDTLPPEWQEDLVCGLRLALFVRAMNHGSFLSTAVGHARGAARLRAELDHALRAYDATIERDSFLADFTAAC